MTEQKATRILKEEMGWESDSGKIKAFAMAIGTPEECREAMEKQKAKKPIDKCMFSECPNCGNVEIE